MLTSGIYRCLTMDRDFIKEFISDHSHGLIHICDVCGVKDGRAQDCSDDIIFLDPVTTHHFSQLQLMWQDHRSRCPPCREWWVAFRSSMGQMFDKTCNQMNNWRWDNPHVFGDQVYHSNTQTTHSVNAQCTGERFSLYGINDLRAKIELQRCQQYQPGDFLAVRHLKLG